MQSPLLLTNKNVIRSFMPIQNFRIYIYIYIYIYMKKGKRKVQRAPQPQAAALPLPPLPDTKRKQTSANRTNARKAPKPAPPPPPVKRGNRNAKRTYYMGIKRTAQICLQYGLSLVHTKYHLYMVRYICFLHAALIQPVDFHPLLTVRCT